LGSTSAPRFIGGLVGGIVGSKATGAITNNPWVRDLGGVLGGAFGSGTGAAVEDFGKRTSLTIPDAISLPGGFKLKYEVNSPEGTGAPLPAAGDFYENRGADLMRRQRMQDAIDRSNRPTIPVDPVAEAVKNRT